MLNLLSEARFWTCRNDINIKDNDIGAYKYHTKISAGKSSSYHQEGKINYGHERGLKLGLENKRPYKLKNSLKQLETELSEHKIVFCQWKDSFILQCMLSTGLLIHICVNIFTGDILRIAFDKYFVGKLISDNITDVIMTRMHIIISYNENQITFVYLQKPSMRRSNAPEKISRMDPKIFNIIVGGPQSRKLGRYLSCNGSFDLLTIWTKSSQNEVYPWRPTVRDQDRANIYVYKLSRTKLELICYHWTEYDPICVEFSKLNHNQFKSVEQKISKKGDVTIENCTYEINNSTIQRISITSIPLQTQVCCHSLSPDHEKLMLGCIDGSVLLFDEGRFITHHVKAAFIPTLISWHYDSALVMIANERSQFQCFDISLSCVRNQLISEDMTPSNLLDLSGYFQFQPILLKMCWSKKPDLASYTENYVQTDCFLLLLFENGPFTCLRFFGGSGLKGDIHTSGFTADVLVNKYLNLNQVEKAINILLCLNWDTYGAMCLISLHKIANYCFKQILTPDKEIQLQKALASFHIPVKPLCYETETEFGDQVRDITRKFFHYLVRFKSFEKAFSLAIDINDVDLFMDLCNASRVDGDIDLSIECFKKAEEILIRTNSAGSEHSTCSNTSCSICTNSGGSESESEIMIEKNVKKDTNFFIEKDIILSSNLSTSSTRELITNYSLDNLNGYNPPLPNFIEQTLDGSGNSNEHKNSTFNINKNYVPPLPYFTNALNVPSEVKINIPKPELRVSKNKTLNPMSIWNNDTNNKMLRPTPIAPSSIQNQAINSNLELNKIEQFVPRYPDFNKSQFFGSHIDRYSNDNFNYVTSSHANTRLLKNKTDETIIEMQRTIKSSKITPQNLLQQQSLDVLQQKQHVVLDVFPQPKLRQINQHDQIMNNNYEKNDCWAQIPDQTLGIPLIPSANNTLSIFPRATTMGQMYPISSVFNKALSDDNLVKSSPIIHQYPLISGNIPASNISTIKKSSSSLSSEIGNNYTIKNQQQFHIPQPQRSINKDTNSILSNSTLSMTNNNLTTTNSNINIKKDAGEKNKVKFSDTITVAVVPEIPRKEKQKRSNGFHGHDPRRELRDSLPLSHPNDDYLKNFTPMSDVKNNDTEEPRTENSIKVVHFGVV